MLSVQNNNFFQKMFGRFEELCRDFASGAIGQPIRSIEYLDIIPEVYTKKDKDDLKPLCLNATLSKGKRCSISMQSVTSMEILLVRVPMDDFPVKDKSKLCKKRYVIYICSFDPFGQDQIMYEMDGIDGKKGIDYILYNTKASELMADLCLQSDCLH